MSEQSAPFAVFSAERIRLIADLYGIGTDSAVAAALPGPVSSDINIFYQLTGPILSRGQILNTILPTINSEDTLPIALERLSIDVAL